jgi:dTDP-4-amino-4,6-dideoxygalactose transaminase
VSIPITRPLFDDRESQAVADVLRSGWVSQGPRVGEFEAAFARYAGSRHAVATSSCTSALHMALVALGIEAGDEVLLPAFTFVATANAVEYCRATPVFVDIDLDTFNIDLGQIERRITPRTRAIMPVHLFGLAANMPAILDIARRHRLRVIEDAACAVGTRTSGRHAGTFGDAGCFSFHPRKVITTGEGGMLITDDGALAQRVRSLRNHAAVVSDLERHAANGAQLPGFPEIGFNYRMTDVQAAIGIAQMEKLDAILDRRRALAARYDTALRPISWLRTPHVPAGDVHSYQSYVVLIARDAPTSRDQLAAALEGCGIATRQGTHAVHALECYRTRYGLSPQDLPNSWEADQRSLTLPLYPTMTVAEHDRVVEAVTTLGRAAAVGDRVSH